MAATFVAAEKYRTVSTAYREREEDQEAAIPITMRHVMSERLIPNGDNDFVTKLAHFRQRGRGSRAASGSATTMRRR